MGTKKEKREASLRDVNSRISKLEENIKVPLDSDYMTVLLKDKSPKYYVRFAAWARDTLDRESHMENLVQAILSKFAVDVLTQRSDFTDEFLAGQASGILFLFEEMQRLSNPNSFNVKD